MKKFLTFVLVLAMVMSVSGVAMAAGNVAEFNGTEYATLQAAIDAAEAVGGTITLRNDCAENVTVEQKENVQLTIDGNGKTMTGTITVDGKSKRYDTAGVTIENVKFNASSISDACIRLGDGTDATRYTNNVTVKDCSFTDTDKTAAAIKQYTGGCLNLTVTGCTATGMHSLMQLKNVEKGLTIENCSVTGGKNGISLGCSEEGVTITGCRINVDGYGIRIGASGSPYNSDITIRGTEITAKQPVVAREKDDAGKLDLDVNDENNKFESTVEDNYPIVVTSGDDGTDAKASGFEVPNEEGINIKGAKKDIPGGYIMAYEPPTPESKPSSGSGIDVEYEGGNSFSTSKTAVPTSVEIDGVEVPFTGDGKFFTVGCIDPSAEWVTVRWNSTSVTTNFTPDGLDECSAVAIPKTGDMPFFAAVAAFFGF